MIICPFDIFDALHLISFQGSITLVCVTFWAICYYVFIVSVIALFGEVFNPLHPRLHHLFFPSRSPSLTHSYTSTFNWLINCALNSYLSLTLMLSQSIHISLILFLSHSLSRWMFSLLHDTGAITLQMMLQIRFKCAFSFSRFFLLLLIPLSSYYCIYSTVCCSHTQVLLLSFPLTGLRVPFWRLKWINSFSLYFLTSFLSRNFICLFPLFSLLRSS